MKRKWLPRKGQVFHDRDELEHKLLDSGWEFEGHGQGLDKGKIIDYDIGVTDKGNDVWIMVYAVPLGIKVTKVKKLKLSDYGNERK